MFPIEFLRRSALERPHAIVAIDGDRQCTYAELLARAEALGSGIQARAGRPRPVVAILGPNSIEMLVALMAIHASGAVLVPLNGRNARPELDAQIARAAPDVMIVHNDYQHKITAVSCPVLIADGDPSDPLSTLNIESEHHGRRPQWEAALSDVNGIKFTGGSSGVPKGVLQSFRSINTLVASVLIAFELNEHERYLCAAPITHGAGAMLLPVLARGGCIIMTADPKPGNLLELIERERITLTWVPPTLLYAMIDEQKRQPRRVDSLRHLIWSAAPATPARLREAQEVFGPVIETVYGQTEAPLILTYARAEDLTVEARLASVGRTAPLAEVAILDAEGRELGPGEIGEVCVRSDLVMNGYLDMPEETAKTMRDGWLRTGDGGMFDQHGFLYLKDRLRDVIISGGFNVYPSDVESIIATHADVAEVVVFGVPDSYWGERVEAAVELRAGVLADEQAIIDYCKRLAGSVKAPKRLHILESLPRSPVGKVLRREARERAIASDVTQDATTSLN